MFHGKMGLIQPKKKLSQKSILSHGNSRDEWRGNAELGMCGAGRNDTRENVCSGRSSGKGRESKDGPRA